MVFLSRLSDRSEALDDRARDELQGSLRSVINPRV